MQYTLRVFAVILAAASIAFSATPQDTVPELSSALSLFSAQATATDGVRLNWSLDHQSPTIIKFRVYRGYEEVGNFAVLTEMDARSGADGVDYSFKDVSAKPAVSYYYKLAAAGQNSESVFPVVITATVPEAGGFKETELPSATILRGDAITLYVRKAGHVKLTTGTSDAKTLVNQDLRPGIYELQMPAGVHAPLELRLEHSGGLTKEFRWPIE